VVLWCVIVTFHLGRVCGVGEGLVWRRGWCGGGVGVGEWLVCASGGKLSQQRRVLFGHTEVKLPVVMTIVSGWGNAPTALALLFAKVKRSRNDCFVKVK